MRESVGEVNTSIYQFLTYDVNQTVELKCLTLNKGDHNSTLKMYSMQEKLLGKTKAVEEARLGELETILDVFNINLNRDTRI